jgi:alkyl hydroperoxide reductase subunit AhpF
MASPEGMSSPPSSRRSRPSRQGSRASPLRLKEVLKGLKRPVHLQVFVTLTCPYCPAAVQLAHRMALESDLVRADMVESAEFPHLVQRYGVFAVPKTVVNEGFGFEGALPEPLFLEEIMRAIVSIAPAQEP